MADDDIAALREDLTRTLLGGPWGEAAAVTVLLGFEPVARRPCGADVCRVPFLDDGFYETWLAMVTASRTGVVP